MIGSCHLLASLHCDVVLSLVCLCPCHVREMSKSARLREEESFLFWMYLGSISFVFYVCVYLDAKALRGCMQKVLYGSQRKQRIERKRKRKIPLISITVDQSVKHPILHVLMLEIAWLES
jgi:hypothetical protein